MITIKKGWHDKIPFTEVRSCKFDYAVFKYASLNALSPDMAFFLVPVVMRYIQVIKLVA